MSICSDITWNCWGQHSRASNCRGPNRVAVSAAGGQYLTRSPIHHGRAICLAAILLPRRPRGACALIGPSPGQRRSFSPSSTSQLPKSAPDASLKARLPRSSWRSRRCWRAKKSSCGLVVNHRVASIFPLDHPAFEVRNASVAKIHQCVRRNLAHSTALAIEDDRCGPVGGEHA